MTAGMRGMGAHEGGKESHLPRAHEGPDGEWKQDRRASSLKEKRFVTSGGAEKNLNEGPESNKIFARGSTFAGL